MIFTRRVGNRPTFSTLSTLSTLSTQPHLAGREALRSRRKNRRRPVRRRQAERRSRIRLLDRTLVAHIAANSLKAQAAIRKAGAGNFVLMLQSYQVGETEAGLPAQAKAFIKAIINMLISLTME
jgi:hypothetical protein